MYKDRIVLGSGDLFCMLFAGSIPDDETIETDDNQLGDIKGGCTLEYSVTKYKAVSDNGRRSKTIVTEEAALLKSGIMTWNGNTLEKLVSTARVSTNGKKRIVKIGGIDNQKDDKYLIRFRHKDAADGDCRVTIIGTNQAGLSIAFLKDTETVINAEFAAEPHDDEGTLIIYEEDIIGENAAAAASDEPTDGEPAYDPEQDA